MTTQSSLQTEPSCSKCNKKLGVQTNRALSGGLGGVLYKGVICYRCKKVLCLDCQGSVVFKGEERLREGCKQCENEPADSEPRGRTVPCFSHHYSSFRALGDMPLTADETQKAAVLEFWRRRPGKHRGVCQGQGGMCGEKIERDGYLSGFPPELRCEDCAKNLISIMLRDKHTVNDFWQQLGEACHAPLPSQSSAKPWWKFWS